MAALADGVSTGGLGLEAAQTTVMTLVEDWYGTPATWDPTVALDRVILAHNAWLVDHNRRRERLEGKAAQTGTCTLTAVVLRAHGFTLAHVGDSRAYLVRADECTQLTADHSRVAEMVRMKILTPEEAVAHPARNQLTRSLGTDLAVQVDLTRTPVEQADTIVLCTDGIWDVVSRVDIAEAIASMGGDRPSPVAAVDQLIEMALKRGASDNVTALTVTMTSALPIPAAAGRRFFRRGRP